MAEDIEEVEEITTIASALVINIGTLTKLQIESMKLSAKTANKTDTPIILDPVGVGVSKLRNDTTIDLIENYDIATIRGNISEIKAIAKLTGLIDENNTAKGVDVNIDDIITKLIHVADEGVQLAGQRGILQNQVEVLAHETRTGSIRNDHRELLAVKITIFRIGADDLIAQILGILHLAFHKEAAAAAGTLLVVMAELLQPVEHRDDTRHRLRLEQIHLAGNVQKHRLLRI